MLFCRVINVNKIYSKFKCFFTWIIILGCFLKLMIFFFLDWNGCTNVSIKSILHAWYRSLNLSLEWNDVQPNKKLISLELTTVNK